MRSWSRDYLNFVKPLQSPQPELLLGQSILFQLVKLFFFFEAEHPFNNKPKVKTDPAVPSAQLLGLGSKRYPSNVPRMLNKDVTRSMQSLSSSLPKSSKRKKGSPGRVVYSGGSRGGPPSFLDQTVTRRNEKKFFGDRSSPLISGSRWPPPLHLSEGLDPPLVWAAKLLS